MSRTAIALGAIVSPLSRPIVYKLTSGLALATLQRRNTWPTGRKPEACLRGNYPRIWIEFGHELQSPGELPAEIAKTRVVATELHGQAFPWNERFVA